LEVQRLTIDEELLLIVRSVVLRQGGYEWDFPKATRRDIWDDGKGTSEFGVIDNPKTDFTVVGFTRTLKVDTDQLTRDQVVVCQLIHHSRNALRIGLGQCQS
jgi:hypothetical protein